MAKEGDLKKVELKVLVHCCDGCKKKVKKVLRRIEGVFQTEIDPLEPKVTILGNVEPQILIKKLLKAGKQSEIWSHENPNRKKENKETKSPTIKTDKENSTSGREQTKKLETQATSADKPTERAINKEGECNKTSKDTDCGTNTSTNPGALKIGHYISNQPEANGVIHPTIVHDTSKAKVEMNTPYYYMVEPQPIILPYCAIYPYNVPPLMPTHTSNQGVYNYAGPGIICQPQVEATPTRVGDYFSDENTVGCQVM